jgi:endonuclease-3
MVSPREAEALLDRLERFYPQAECALQYQTPWQLLAATILSAQCTDKRVNLVTDKLFAEYPTSKAMAAAPLDRIEELIHSTGFYRSKARHLVDAARMVEDLYRGVVPDQRSELVKLPGVGRKTANVVLGNIFNVPAMVVDTHVKRLSRRFGWTLAAEPGQIEKDLMLLLPPARWVTCGHTLIEHGRTYCKAPVPRCSQCPVADLCPRTGVDKSH